MSAIVTFGETMLRLSPANPGERLTQALQFRVEPGGSESNVAIALAMLGHKVFHVTRLPDNPLGDLVLNHLRWFGVDVSRVERGGKRVGCYWTEIGIGPRPSRVIYDRTDSAFATWTADEVDWASAFSGAEWLHVTGITPGISQTAADTLSAELEAVPAHVKVSLDLNYRKTLWSYVTGDIVAAYVRQRMAAYCERCDVLFGNESDFQDTLGLSGGDSAHVAERYRTIAEAAFERFARPCVVAISLRQSHSATENTWSGLLFLRTPSGVDCFRGPQFELRHIVDRVGSGDSFAAGIVHGLLAYPEAPQKILDFAVTFAALKHTVRGDPNPFRENEVWQVLEMHGTGRILR